MVRRIPLLLLLLVGGSVLGSNPTNMIPNSSFECGGGRGWWLMKGDAEQMFRPELFIVTSEQAHGLRSFFLPIAYKLYAREMWLTNGVTYKFTYYAKASASAVINEIFHEDTDIGAPTITPRIITTSWTRYTSTITPISTQWHFIGFTHASGQTVYLDAVQFEEGSAATTYAPMAPVEASFDIDLAVAFHNMLPSTGPRQGRYRFFNNGASSVNAILYFEIFNVWNEVLSSGLVTNTVPAGAAYTNVFTLPAHNGFQRVVTRLPIYEQGGNDSRDEDLVFVMPTGFDPLVMNTNGFLGSHPDADQSALFTLRRSGTTWVRVGSPIVQARWASVEAVSNVFNWTLADPKIAHVATNHHAIMFGLFGGFDGQIPAWAYNASGNGPLLDKYSNYVWQAVTRYSVPPYNIKYWEGWNEPQSACGQGLAWFCTNINIAVINDIASGAVKTADPTSKYVAFGGLTVASQAKAIWNLMSTGAQARVDIVSCHLYPKDTSNDPNTTEVDSRPSDWYNEFNGIRPVWNTETGGTENDGHFTEVFPGGYNYYGGFADWKRGAETTEGVLNAERVVQGMTRSAGYGMKKYFYYDNRDPTEAWINLTALSMWSYSTAMRATGVAVSIWTMMCDDFRNQIPFASVDAVPLEFYYFNVAGSSNVVVTWAYDKGSYQLTVTNNNFTVYDMMGNVEAQPPNKLDITRHPKYVVSTMLSSNQLVQTLANALVVELTDTNGPNISIDVAPSGQWQAGSPIFTKWSAMDKRWINYTNPANGDISGQTNVDYSWKLDQAAYSPWSGSNLLYGLTLSSGNHTLWVRARDIVGNISERPYVFDMVGTNAPGGGPPPDPPPGGLAGRFGRNRFPIGGFP